MTRTAVAEAPSRIRIRHYDGAAVVADLAPWIHAYEEVYRQDISLSDHSDPPIGDRLTRHADRPGFTLVAAHDGEEVAGYLYGYTLPTDTLWWEGLTPDPDPEFVREYPGRTVGMCELLVGVPWRRTRVALSLAQAFLADRTEERAAGLIAEGNDVMLSNYAKHGFTQVGRMEPFPGWRPHTMIVRDLR